MKIHRSGPCILDSGELKFSILGFIDAVNQVYFDAKGALQNEENPFYYIPCYNLVGGL